MKFICKLFALLFLSWFVSACSVVSQQASAPENTVDRLVSQDFVHVMAQIDRLQPASTTLNFQSNPGSTDPFASALLETLQQAGYAIRVEPTVRGEFPVSFHITEKVSSTEGKILTYEVSVGDVSMRRSYRPMSDHAFKPVATMQVKGVDASTIRLDHRLFDEQAEPADASPLMAKSDQDTPVSEPLLVEAPMPVVTPVTSAPVSSADVPVFGDAEVIVGRTVTAQASKIPSERNVAFGALSEPPKPLVDIAAPSMASLTRKGPPLLPDLSELSSRETTNVKDLGKSNFADFLDQFGIVRETILTFGDDSLRLGDVQKYRINGLVDKFRADEDVFSVIGCSHGPTRYKDGQEGLAIERAKRVKEALLYAGVPEDRILDEGCWAEEAFDERMPRRGVVLMLKRSNKT